MTDKLKLLPCPFCGGSARHECQDTREHPKPCHYVVCSNCGIQGESGSNDIMAGDRWNTRADLAPAPKADTPTPPNAALDDMREKFETWLTGDGNYPHLKHKHFGGNYLHEEAAMKWDGFKEGYKAALRNTETKG